jgi:hypothetical protein
MSRSSAQSNASVIAKEFDFSKYKPLKQYSDFHAPPVHLILTLFRRFFILFSRKAF